MTASHYTLILNSWLCNFKPEVVPVIIIITNYMAANQTHFTRYIAPHSTDQQGYMLNVKIELSTYEYYLRICILWEYYKRITAE